MIFFDFLDVCLLGFCSRGRCQFLSIPINYPPMQMWRCHLFLFQPFLLFKSPPCLYNFPYFLAFLPLCSIMLLPPKLRTVGCDVDTVAIMVWFDDLGLCNLLKFYSDFKALWDLSCLPRCERRFGLICCLCLVISIQVILLRLDGVNEVVAFTANG